MDKLLTFSIAAYNVEDYLPKLFNSLIDKRYIDTIEILVIDDGSSDKTAEIAKKYQDMFPDSVRLVTKENGGHGSTINRGIRDAKGKYFRALDGDDWVDSEALFSLLQRIKSVDADLILTNYYKCYQDGRIVKDCFDNLEDGKQYTFDEVAPLVKWMRYHTVIYRTSILQNAQIHLDEHCFYVDSEFMIFPIPYIHSVVFYEYGIYCYRLGAEGQSVSPLSRMRHYRDSYIVTKSLMNMYKNLSENMSIAKKHYIEFGIAGHCVWHFRTIMTFPPEPRKRKELLQYEKQIRKQSKAIFKEMEHQGATSRLISVMRKTNYLLYYPVGWVKQLKNRVK